MLVLSKVTITQSICLFEKSPPRSPDAQNFSSSSLHVPWEPFINLVGIVESAEVATSSARMIATPSRLAIKVALSEQRTRTGFNGRGIHLPGWIITGCLRRSSCGHSKSPKNQKPQGRAMLLRTLPSTHVPRENILASNSPDVLPAPWNLVSLGTNNMSIIIRPACPSRNLGKGRNSERGYVLAIRYGVTRWRGGNG